jgi:hypothetical protein
MEIKVPKALAQAIGFDKLRLYQIETHSFYNRSYVLLELNKYTAAQVEQLEALVKPFDRGSSQMIRGAATLLYDIANWRKLMENPAGQKPRNMSHFTALLTEHLRSVDGHRVYIKDHERWLPYYVNSVVYVPKCSHHGGGVTPAHCDISLLYSSFGVRSSRHLTFWFEDVRGKDVTQTPELREAYLRDKARWEAESDCVGKQFLATGEGMSEAVSDDWWRKQSAVQLDKDDAAVRVVIDIPSEGDHGSRSRNKLERDTDIDENFWGVLPGAGEKDEAKDEDDEAEAAARGEEPVKSLAYIEIPLHTVLMVFDLSRQLRVEVYIDQLTEYVYDATLGSKLVLPKDARHLVDLLMAGTGGFQDIIGNKGGGSIIACTGIPGTGKTLTSEVYAEVAHKPLYTVQCSQLGTSPDELEAELLKVFARSQRWSAILLLDEADVYVAKRGSDLTQNAIVGVFLRVLEYYRGVMFLTTNRADLIDDAVLSRCIARIDYATPAVDDQRKIWRVLADNAKLSLSDATIEQILTAHPKLTGRDIKNLLKLGSMIAKSEGKEIDLATIEFAKRFKPTQE